MFTVHKSINGVIAQEGKRYKIVVPEIEELEKIHDSPLGKRMPVLVYEMFKSAGSSAKVTAERSKSRRDSRIQFVTANRKRLPERLYLYEE